MVKNLRPRQAADALGVGLSTFWKMARENPEFPTLIKLGPKLTVVREADLEAFVKKSKAHSERAKETAK